MRESDGTTFGVTPQMMKPCGWFQIGWSSDFPAGAVVPKHYLGEQLVVFRTEAGQLRALDAYCGHMGAHLGVGGRVCADAIVCPYHGWEWDGDGRNVAIPYEDRPNRARRIRSWPVFERNDIVYLWHHWDGTEPTWDVPDVFESQGERVAARQYHDAHPDGQIRLGHRTLDPYVVLDNVADPAHFKFVHHTKDVASIVRSEADGHLFRVRLGFGSSWRRDPASARGDALDILEIGVGLSFTALGGEHLPYAVIVLATTPIDDTASEMFQTVWLEHVPGDEDPDQLARRLHHATHQLPFDIQIWENQRYLRRPAWGASEVRGFTALRRWASNFYQASDNGHRDHARAAGQPPGSPSDVAWRFWQAAGDGDMDEAIALLDPDGVWWSRPIGEVPMSAIAEFLSASLEHVPIRFTLHDVHSGQGSDTVALEVEGHGQVADGTLYNNRYCFVMTVRDGRILRVHEYVDTLHARDVLLANLPPDILRTLTQPLGEDGPLTAPATRR